MKPLAITPILLLFLLGSYTSRAQFHDSEYKFSIDIPANWSQNSYMDGTDKVYDFYSPDENAAVQLRAFKSMDGLTLDLLTQVYEQNYLPAGTQKESLRNHTSTNGIPGKQGVYVMDYQGNKVGMSSFFMLQNGFGYVLTAIIPISMMEQKSPEVKSITQSFRLDGMAPAETKKHVNNNPHNQSTGCPDANSITYQGQTYRTVQIGNQCWMAENLNVGSMIAQPGYPKDDNVIEKYCPDYNESKCAKYGGLYTWNEMMAYSKEEGAQGICPQGWHLPTEKEWRILEAYADSEFKNPDDPTWEKKDAQRGKDAAKHLKSSSGWHKNHINGDPNTNGTDKYGFNALPAGVIRDNLTYAFEGRVAYFWTSTPNPTWGDLANRRAFREYTDHPERSYKAKKYLGYSVRCIKN